MNKYFWFSLFLACFPSAFTASAQPRLDSTYRPEIYPFMVDQSSHYQQSNNDIVFVGNSITFWGNWIELLGNPYVRNRGIPGDITYGILERLPHIVDGNPAKIFIMIGINDLARGIPVRIILDNYKKMIEMIRSRSPSTRIYFHTLLPVNESFDKLKNHYGKDEQIVRINAALRELALEESVQLIDLYQYFVDDKGKLKERYTWDGVHLTADAYQLWADVLKKNEVLLKNNTGILR